MASAQANIRNFITHLKGPGRTAPAFLEDLTLYDPRQPVQPGKNLLHDSPLNFIYAPQIYEVLPPDSCRHLFCIKPRQSCPPTLDERPSPTSIYQVAAVCKECRIHLSLKVDYRIAWKDSPCPNQDHPLHHLVSSTWRQNMAMRELQEQTPDATDEVFVYECSSLTCSAVVSVQLSPPVLEDDVVHILTDPEQLKKRTDEALEIWKGDTEGMRRPSALDVLNDLRIYMKHSWDPNAKREIKLDNRRFAMRFGPEGRACSEVLEHLRFTLKPQESWQTPEVDRADTAPLQNLDNVFLDNVEAELAALIAARPADERQASHETSVPTPAALEMSRSLACQNYDRFPGSRTIKKEAANRTRSYTLLGVPHDISDDLVLFAYRKQTLLAPDQIPYFLTALKSIEKERNSEAIATQVALELSMGRYGIDVLQGAYRSLGLSLDTSPEDDTIIGTFQARLRDSPSHEREMREHLYMIGDHRGSRKIMDFARSAIVTYEDALQFLGADTDTDDSFIPVLYTSKVSDDESNTGMAQKAVNFIAMHRDSDGLKTFVASGFEGDLDISAMDTAEAFQVLGIGDRTLDDETLYAVYTARLEEEPGNAARIQKAIETIATDRDSSLLRSTLQLPGGTTTSNTVIVSEPVGLENIGNTCYLNSLLQWFFTIVPVRDVVLNFDQYKMELTAQSMAVKQVGHRKISRREVETAQQFAVTLATLFQQMITSPNSTIKPEQELARLTLETDMVKNKIRRSSTLQSARRPTLGHIDSHPILGPLPESAMIDTTITEQASSSSPQPMEMSEMQTALLESPKDFRPVESSTEDVEKSHQAIDPSEGTVLSRLASNEMDTTNVEITSEQQQNILDNKENISPTKTDEPSGKTYPQLQPPEPLRPASPSKVNVQAGALTTQPEVRSDEDVKQQPIVYQPPPGPPPVPPRKPVDATKTKLEEWARQQDVTEVVGHCIFQLSCAMRPTSIDQKTHEQEDEVHKTFFGESTYHEVPEAASAAPPNLFWSIQAGIFNEPKDVYAALDNEFDISQRDNGTWVYQSIIRLPPVLTISYGRAVYDEKSLSQKKLNTHIDMPTTIYMDRYLDAPDDSQLMQRRKQTWHLKQQVARFVKRKNDLERSSPLGTIPEILNDTRQVLEHLQAIDSTDMGLGNLGVKMETINAVALLAEKTRLELQEIKRRIVSLQQQIDESFTDSGFRNHEYKLHAAFFHRGTVGSGHYWVYIFDHVGEIWRKYNDEQVTHVKNLNEIFADPRNDNGNSNSGYSPAANPYFLVYVRAQDIGQGLVETVKRDAVIDDERGRVHDDGSDGVLIQPLGSDSKGWQDTSHVEYAGQRNQFSEVPPEGFRSMTMGGTTETATDNAWAGKGEDRTALEDSERTDMAVHQGNWDNSEASQLGRQW